MSEKLPSGVELTPIDDTYRNNPYPRLHKLRNTAPVYADPDFAVVVATRHEDVQKVLRDKDMLSDPRKANENDLSSRFAPEGDQQPSMLFMDDPDHKRLRNLVNKAFTPRAVEEMRPRIRDIVDTLLRRVDTEEFDLIAALAAPLPSIVIAEMLGIDAGLHHDFKQWSDISTDVFFNMFPSEEQVAQATAASESLNALFRAEIEKRRGQDQGDLIGAMVRAEEDGDSLTTDEIVSQCNLLLVAGNVTTTDLIGNGVKALLDFPDQFEKLKDNADLIENAVEEMLRFDSPVVNSGRIAPAEMELDGCPVHKGQSISTSLGAANRDPSVHPDPDRFDVARQNIQHQSFGGGRHFCLGAPLARVEAQEAVRGLITKFPNLRHSERGFVYKAVPSFRGMSEFWVRA